MGKRNAVSVFYNNGVYDTNLSQKFEERFAFRPVVRLLCEDECHGQEPAAEFELSRKRKGIKDRKTADAFENQIIRELCVGAGKEMASLLRTDLRMLDAGTCPLGHQSIMEAQVLMGEEMAGEQYLFIAPEQSIQLRRDPYFIEEAGRTPWGYPVFGRIFNCRVIISARIVQEPGGFRSILAKPGAAELSVRFKTVNRDFEASVQSAVSLSLSEEAAYVNLLTASNISAW